MNEDIKLDVCHLISVTEDELSVLKLCADTLISLTEGTDIPPVPSQEERQRLLALFRRIKEM